MPSLTRKTIKGRPYYYLRYTQRVNGVSKVVKTTYLGSLEKILPRLLGQEALAAEFASKSPIAIRLAKHAMNSIELMTVRDGYRFEQGMTGELSKSEDSREAMRAFVEKRPPVFKGR